MIHGGVGVASSSGGRSSTPRSGPPWADLRVSPSKTLLLDDSSKISDSSTGKTSQFWISHVFETPHHGHGLAGGVGRDEVLLLHLALQGPRYPPPPPSSSPLFLPFSTPAPLSPHPRPAPLPPRPCPCPSSPHLDGMCVEYSIS